jgi:hypothetical protein
MPLFRPSHFAGQLPFARLSLLYPWSLFLTGDFSSCLINATFEGVNGFEALNSRGVR